MVASCCKSYDWPLGTRGAITGSLISDTGVLVSPWSPALPPPIAPPLRLLLPQTRGCWTLAVGCCPFCMPHVSSSSGSSPIPSQRERGKRMGSLPRRPRGSGLVVWGIPVLDKSRHGQTFGFQAESISKMIRALQNSVQVCRRIRDTNPLGGEVWGIVKSLRHAALPRSRGYCQEAVSQYGGTGHARPWPT